MKTRIAFLFFGLVIFALFFVSVDIPTFATMYQPGETLEPDCAPGSESCGVLSSTSEYSAGDGISLSSGVLSIDSSFAHTWLASQQFNASVTLADDFIQSGSGSFSTGSGPVTFNGDTLVSGVHTFTVGTGATVLGGTLNVSDEAVFSSNVNVGDELTVDNTLVFSGTTISSTGVLNVNNGIYDLNIGTDSFSKQIVIGNSTGDTGLSLVAGAGGVLIGSAQRFTPVSVSNLDMGGEIGSADTTVDIATSFDISQDTPDQVISLPSPTVSDSGRFAIVNNVGTTGFTFLGSVVAPGSSRTALWTGSSWSLIGASTAPMFSDILGAQIDNSLDNQNFSQNWHWDSLTSETGLALGFDSLTSGKGVSITSSSNALEAGGSLLSLGLNGGASNGWLFRAEDTANDTTPFVINWAGNVGIGDDNPQHLLDLRSETGDVVLGLTPVDSNSSAYMMFQSSSNVPVFTFGLDKSDDNKLKIGTDALNSGTRLTIDSNGLVGVGTSNPQNLLDLISSSGDAAINITSPAGNPLIKIGVNQESPNFVMGVDVSDGEKFKISNNAFGSIDSFVITSSGNIGIRTLSPSTESAITLGNADGDATQGGQLAFSPGSAGDTTWFFLDSVSNENDSEFRVLDGASDTATDTRAYITSGLNGWQTPSDSRLKTNVRTIPAVLDRMHDMRGVQYDLVHGGAQQIGVIAQEVMKAYPEIVTRNSQGVLGVNYDSIAAIALQGVKELNDKVDSSISSRPLTLLSGISSDGVVATVSANLQSYGTLTSEGDLAARGKSAFYSDATFKDSVLFEGSVRFDSNIAGIAVVPSGSLVSHVQFSKPHRGIPIVSLTPRSLSHIRYAVTDVRLDGFTISIDSAQSEDVQFSWVAVDVESPVATPR